MLLKLKKTVAISLHCVEVTDEETTRLFEPNLIRIRIRYFEYYCAALGCVCSPALALRLRFNTSAMALQMFSRFLK